MGTGQILRVSEATFRALLYGSQSSRIASLANVYGCVNLSCEGDGDDGPTDFDLSNRSLLGGNLRRPNFRRDIQLRFTISLISS